MRPKVRDVYTKSIVDFSIYSEECERYVKSLGIPKRSGAKLNAKMYVANIKMSLWWLKRKRSKEIFENILRYESAIKAAIKINYDTLESLPSIDNVSRIVRIVEFCLQKSDFELVGERVAMIINCQNSFRTLSYDEISSVGLAFQYVLIKRLAIVINELNIIRKMKQYAEKYSKSNSFGEEKVYKQLKNSKLFLSFCVDSLGDRCQECIEARNRLISRIKDEIDAILTTINNISKIDFSGFYAPLQIFNKYQAFDEANDCTKKAFLGQVKQQSDKENIDEMLYAIRIDNYLKSASAGHIRAINLSIFSSTISAICVKKSIVMLSAALTSKVMMSLLFGINQGSKTAKSIINNAIFENTNADICRFKAINLGVATINDRLIVKPHLPKNIEAVDLKLSHCGTTHDIHIKRGDNPSIYLGETKLTGTSEIHLGEKPLDVTYVLPKNS